MPRPILPVLASLSLVLASMGCQNHIQSTLTVNGAAFHPTSCHNGSSLGFFGVEFQDSTGARLRLQSTASGMGFAYFFAAGAAMPITFGACGALAINRQSSTVNNVPNVQGNATLNCSSGSSTLQGTIQFSNCH